MHGDDMGKVCVDESDCHCCCFLCILITTSLFNGMDVSKSPSHCAHPFFRMHFIQYSFVVVYQGLSLTGLLKNVLCNLTRITQSVSSTLQCDILNLNMV